MSSSNSTDQTFITDDGSIGSQPVTWDGEPLFAPATIKEGLFDTSAFAQQPGQLAMSDEPRKFWGVMHTDTAALTLALNDLVVRGEIIDWRPASDFECRSLWRAVVSLPGCEQKLTEDGAWTLVNNCRELRS